MEIVLIVCIITLSVVIALILLLLGFLFYNQMLVNNEVNKRLLLLSQNSIERERTTKEELQDALVELDRATNELQTNTPSSDAPSETIDDEPFNPHDISENYRED